MDYRTIRNCVLLALVVIGWLFTDSCERPNAGGIGICTNGYCLKEAQLDNVRFEPLLTYGGSSFAMHRSANIWLRKGEQLQVKWDSFETHWVKQGELDCPFSDNSSTEPCVICDFCLPNGGSGAPCLNGFVFGRYDALLSYEGFILESQPKVRHSFQQVEYETGCPMSGNPLTFAPDVNAVERFVNPLQADVIEGESQVHVLAPGQKDTTAYQLTGQAIDGTNFWTWSVSGDPWLENFSPNLRVTNIRVLKGRCMSDPLSGKCDPGSSPAVQPSRILFLPGFADSVVNYQGGEPLHRCYSNPSGTADGVFFDLDSCRPTYAVGSLSTSMKSVTPTFEFLPQDQFTKITWLVEFNSHERGDSDLSTVCSTTAPFAGCETPALGQDLIIEFTVEAS